MVEEGEGAAVFCRRGGGFGCFALAGGGGIDGGWFGGFVVIDGVWVHVRRVAVTEAIGSDRVEVKVRIGRVVGGWGVGWVCSGGRVVWAGRVAARASEA